MGYDDHGGWRPYITVAQRRRQAAREVAALRKKGRSVDPVNIGGQKIARTFWGQAWCGNLESYSDYANRLPRGRTYVRNGSVIDLRIDKGQVAALVSGSSIYAVDISIRPAKKARWKDLIGQCAGKIDSVVELLQGRFSKGVMKILARARYGPVPVTPRNRADLFVSGLGGNVQARGGCVVRNRSPSRSCAGDVIRVAWCGSDGPGGPSWPQRGIE